MHVVTCAHIQQYTFEVVTVNGSALSVYLFKSSCEDVNCVYTSTFKHAYT